MAAGDSVVATAMAALRTGEEEARAAMRRRVRVRDSSPKTSSDKVDGKAATGLLTPQPQQALQRESSSAPGYETASASILKVPADEETGVTRLLHANTATPPHARTHSDCPKGHKASNAVETSKLSSVLAARKAQVGRATTVAGLSTMRQAGWDSDDEDGDEEDEEANLQTGNMQRAERGSSARGAAPPAALSFERALNLLTDLNASQRYDALTQLRTLRLSPESEKEMLRPLLLRFADSSERVREAAAALFDAWQKRVDVGVLGGALPFLVPVLVERLGTEAQAEPAEEIRAILVSMTANVLTRCRQLLRPYLAEVGAICLGCCRDRHPEVLKGACALMRVLGEAVLQPLVKREGGKAVQPFSAKLIEALLPHLSHRHAAVRVQVLHALEELLLCGAGQSVETLVGWRLENNVPIAEFYGKASPRRNYLADLSRDRSVSVRRRFVQCLGRWVEWMDGADLYEQEVRLVPYIASALFDEDETLREEARHLLEHLGAVYLSLNESDFKENIEYCHTDEAAKDAALAPSLPPPFRSRPSIGARARVRTHFRALIHPIVAELQSWTAVERLQSVKLLEVLLVYTEDFATEFAHQILPALAKAMEDDTPALAQQSGRCAELFARHVPAHAYMPLALSQLRPDALNTLSTRTNYFALMPHLLRGMAAADAASAAAALLTELLADEVACAKHSPLRRAMRETIAAIGFIRSGAAVTVADGGAGRETVDLVAAVPMQQLLLAIFLWHGSSPTLLPQSVAIGEGLEELRGAESGLVAQAAAAVADEVAAMLLQAEREAAGLGAYAELVVHALRPHAASLNVSLEAAASSAPAATHILRLLLAEHNEEMLLAPPPRARPHAAQAAKTKLVILEVDDVEDDDDESEDGDGRAGPAAAGSGGVNGCNDGCGNVGNDAAPQSAGHRVQLTDSSPPQPGLATGPPTAEQPGEQPRHHACNEVDDVNDERGRRKEGEEGGLAGCDRGGDGKQNHGGGGRGGMSGGMGADDARSFDHGDKQSGEGTNSDDEEEVPITLVGAQHRNALAGASPDELYRAAHASHVPGAAGAPSGGAGTEAACFDSDDEEDVPIGKIDGCPLDDFEDELD